MCPLRASGAGGTVLIERLPVFHVLLTDVIYREWMGKVERIRPRPSDVQEGWKEGSEERGGNIMSWAESADSNTSTSGSMAQYNKTAAPQDYQVQLVMDYIGLSLCMFCLLRAK